MSRFDGIFCLYIRPDCSCRYPEGVPFLLWDAFCPIHGTPGIYNKLWKKLEDEHNQKEKDIADSETTEVQAGRKDLG